jgi:hypothetical protein
VSKGVKTKTIKGTKMSVNTNVLMSSGNVAKKSPKTKKIRLIVG